MGAVLTRVNILRRLERRKLTRRVRVHGRRDSASRWGGQIDNRSFRSELLDEVIR